MGTRNLLDMLARANTPPECTILASSANVYGNSKLEVLSEDSPVNPVNDYAVSKLAMEYMAKTFMDRLPIVITRPFNYTGIGQDKRFLIPKIIFHYGARRDVIQLGNLDVHRDFSDVRDVARAYFALAGSQAAGEIINICSGTTISLGTVLEKVESISGHSLKVEINPKLIRKNEVKYLAGDPSKLHTFLPLTPGRDITATISWMINVLPERDK